jgi:hypothetical protein
MYRTFLSNYLNTEELKHRNMHCGNRVKYCNGFCQDFRNISDFSRTSGNNYHTLCKNCRNRVSIAEQLVEQKKVSINEIKENPCIIDGFDGEIESNKRCRVCKVEKGLSQFTENRATCKACRALQASDRDKSDLKTYISDIEKLKNNFDQLENFVSNIPKGKLIHIISHLQIGRKASDTKPRMVHNIVQHYKNIANPKLCRGGCGFELKEDNGICDSCKRKDTIKTVKRTTKRNVEFEDQFDTIVKDIKSNFEEHKFNYRQIYRICRALKIRVTQKMKKSETVSKLRTFLRVSEESEEKKRVEEEKKLLMNTEEKKIETFRLELNGMVIESRPSDGFVNATALCKAGGKEFRYWYRLQETKDLISALESDVQICTSQLVDIKKGNSRQFKQGSWIHPDLAVQLAQWISPLFALRVSRWVREIALTGTVDVTQEKTHEQLLQLQNMVIEEKKKRQTLEQKHQQLLYRRSHHKFKRGKIFYIISDGDSSESKYKVGIDDVDINVRLAQHRTTVPALHLDYLVYTDSNDILEKSLLQRFKTHRKSYLNHEWLYNIELVLLKESVTTFLDFVCADYTVEPNIDQYNN